MIVQNVPGGLRKKSCKLAKREGRFSQVQTLRADFEVYEV